MESSHPGGGAFIGSFMVFNFNNRQLVDLQAEPRKGRHKSISAVLKKRFISKSAILNKFKSNPNPPELARVVIDSDSNFPTIGV